MVKRFIENSIHLLCLGCVMVLIASCSNDDDEIPYLSASFDSSKVPASGGTVIVDIKSNCVWSIGGLPTMTIGGYGNYYAGDYVSFSPNTGTGNSQLIVSIAPTTQTSEVLYSIEINYDNGSKQERILIRQSASSSSDGNFGGGNSGSGNSGSGDSGSGDSGSGDSGGGDSGSGDSGGGTIIQRPGAPNGLSVSNEGSSSYPGVKISWNYVSNATLYKVYRSSNSSSGFTQIGTTEDNYYTDWYPKSGKNYYRVTAVNDSGESSMSSYVMFNYDTSSSLVPSTPKVSISGTSSLTLTWSCTTGNGYGKAKSYEVYKRNPNTADMELLETTTNTRYTDYNLHPGYNRYAVVAKNDAGESAAAHVMSESVELDYPSSFSASKSGDYVIFTWSKVSKATGYQIFSSTSANGNYYILGQVDDVNTTTKSVYYPASSGTKVYFKIKAYYNAEYIGSPVYSDLSSYKMVTF